MQNLDQHKTEYLDLKEQLARKEKQQLEFEQQIRYRLDFEAIINKISADLIAVDPEETDISVTRALELVADFLCADRGYIFLYSHDCKYMSNTHEWCRAGIRPFKERLQNLAVDSFPWVDRHIKQFKPMIVADVESLGPEAAAEKHEWQYEKTVSLVCLPMVVRGSLIGFIGLDSVLYKMEFTADILSLLQVAGSILGGALERTRLERQLHESKNLLQRVLELLPVGVWVLDEAGTIKYGNPAGLEIWGGARFTGPGEFHEYKGWFLSTGRKIEAHEWAAARAIFKGEISINEEIEIETFKGDRKIILNSALPITDDGRIIGAIIVNEDITARKNADNLLRQSRQMLRSVLDTIPVRVFWKDLDSVYIGCNQQVAEDAGFDSPDKIIGKSDLDLYPEELALQYRRDDQAVMTTGQPKLDYDEEFARDGRHYWIRTSKIPLRDLEGRIVGVLGCWQDVTQSKKLSDELAAKNKELQSVVYVASHDLRSPLVNITGFSRELERAAGLIRDYMEKEKLLDKLDRQTRMAVESDIPEAVAYILGSAKKMELLLAGLLTLSRIGRMNVKFERVNVSQLVASVLQTLEFQVRESNATITVDENLPDCSGSAPELNQVFTNLLNNALKYLTDGRPGHIRISGHCENRWNVYTIEDNGVGISPEYLEKIFELFYRIEPEKTTGEGLGLTIVKRIIDRHHGIITCDSQPGLGTKFTIKLPKSG